MGLHVAHPLVGGDGDGLAVLDVLQVDLDRGAAGGDELRRELHRRPRLAAGRDQGQVDGAGVGGGGEEVFVLLGVLAAEEAFELAFAQHHGGGDDHAALGALDLQKDAITDLFTLSLRRPFRRVVGAAGEYGERRQAGRGQQQRRRRTASGEGMRCSYPGG